jgi:hypothetical protein
MTKDKVLYFLLGAVVGIVIVLPLSLWSAPCNGTSSILMTVQQGLLPCPAYAPNPPLVRATQQVTLMLVIPHGIVVHVGDSFPVTLFVNASGTPVNAVDAVLAYPPSVGLVAKDESVSSFALRFHQASNSLDKVIQVQPNPGIAGTAALAKFTFQALQKGVVMISIASSSEVLANDGFGTNILGPLQNASITVH